MGVLVQSCVLIAAGLVVLLALPVRAADGKAETAETAEAEAAMARARRQASNPLRVILEASKMKRKVVPEADAPPASPSPAAATAAAAQPPSARPVGTATLALNSGAAGNSSTVALSAASAEGLPTLKGADRITLPTAMAPTAAVAQGWMQPKLVEMVEPAIPPRVLDEIGLMVDVRADLSLRADGSVAAVTLVQPVPRQLVRYLTAALERWRYAPLPGEQVHRVQLVFNER